MIRTKKEYPYVVTTILPKGCPIGSKKRTTIRKNFLKTEEEARKEVKAWEKAGLVSGYELR
jgi:hypothetical protein